MNRIKTIKCIGAAGVLFAGLLGASAASATGYGGNRYNDDDDDYRRRHRYNDDDDDYRRRHRYNDDDDDYRRRNRRNRRHRRHYYHNETNLGITDLAFHDLGSTLEAEVTVSGITGTEPVKVDIEAMADLSSACGLADKLDQLDIQSEGSQSIEQADVEGGELDVIVDTGDSAARAASLAECEVEYLDARIDVSQGDQTLTLLCTFAAPTVDGEVADENIECSAF